MKKRTWILAICILAAAFAVLLPTVAGKEEPGAYLTVWADGKPIGTYPLDTDASIPIGSGLVAQIRDHAARVRRSDCPDQICVRQGAVSHPGETIICLPNRVVLKVTGDEGENGVDEVAS